MRNVFYHANNCLLCKQIIDKLLQEAIRIYIISFRQRLYLRACDNPIGRQFKLTL